MLLILTIYVFLCMDKIGGAKVAIDLVNARIIRNVTKEFLSVTMDTTLIKRHWGGIIWWKAVTLASALSPGYLRIGGTNADFLLFEKLYLNETAFNSSSFDYEDEETFGVSSSGGPLPQQFNMTANDMDRISSFSRWSNLSLIFDLNSLLRTEDGQWDWRANVASLLTYTQTQRIHLHFELGNEPNLYHEFNISISPEQLVEDYGTLKKLTQEYFPYYNASKIVGPAVANLNDGGHGGLIYFEKFLEHGGARNVHALTFHHYYLNGRTAHAEQFLDPAIMDTFAERIKAGKDMIKRYVPDQPNFPLWLGETANGYDGGAPGLSDAFISCFTWLDKLGLGASLGLDAIFRQSLFAKNYGLLDERTDPLPNYWLSLLYKRLVGQNVLEVKSIVSPQAYAKNSRFYAHCEENKSTVFGMNLGNDNLTVTLLTKRPSVTIYRYIISAPNGNLLEKSVLLNGKQLQLDGFNIPPLDGVQSKHVIMMPPYSLAFYVIEEKCPM